MELAQQAPNQPAKPDLKALTGLRFFAAFGVVVYHFARPALSGFPKPVQQLAGSGYAAVSFFFLLSGFILSYSYLNRQGTLRGSIKDFYVARFARIYPAYLLAFLLAAPHNVWTSLHANAFTTAVAKLAFSAVALLSLQQAWTPWTAWCWNFPAWSVSVETFFYLSFPFLGPILARLRMSACLLLSGLLWALALLAPLALFLTKGTVNAPELNDHLQMVVEFNPLLRLPEFLIGILLGRAFALGLGNKLPLRGLSYLALAAVIGVLGFVPGIPHPFLANGLLVPLFACLILSLTKDRSLLNRLLSLPVIVLLGEASYGVYILQIPVSYVLRMPPPHLALSTFAVYVAVLLASALLSWKFVELPLRKIVRKRFMTEKREKSAVENTPAPWPQTRPLKEVAGLQ